MMIKYLIEKEFKQILRNSFIPRLIFMMPIIMILVFPWAATQDIKDINICIVDNDHSAFSERLIHKITSSGYFRLSDTPGTSAEALRSVELNKSDIILEIQNDFEANLVKEGSANVSISANAVNSTKAGLGSSYLSAILNDYASELREKWIPSSNRNSALPQINISTQNRFNPYLDYKVLMIPAIMVMLITMLAGFLPALNIVGEKESGTIEQMNVTPVNKFMFILAKLIPYWIIGFIALSICFGLAALVYGLKPAGSLMTIYLFASIYILVVSGLGLVISNYSNTLQQAMFVMYFFVMILILMSGLFTPITSMPDWAQGIAAFNPLKYFIQVMRMVYLKGSGIGELKNQMLFLCGFAVFFNTWAVISYKKNN